MLEVMGEDVRVVKLLDSPMVEEYTVEKTDQPVIIIFRNSLPVIYDGVYSMSNYNFNNYLFAQEQPMMRCWTPSSGRRSQGCRS